MSSIAAQDGNISPIISKRFDKEPQSLEISDQSFSSGYSSLELSFDSTDNVDGPECPPDYTLPLQTSDVQSLMMNDEGIPYEFKESFWGANIRTYEKLNPEKNFQASGSYIHVVTFIVPNGKMEQIHAGKDYVLFEINGAPTRNMTADQLASLLRDVEDGIVRRHQVAQMKFLQIHAKEAIFHNVMFRWQDLDTINVLDYTSSKATKSDISRDDEGSSFVKDLDFVDCKRFIFLRPASSTNESAYYIFSDGKCVMARDYYNSKEKGYIFQIEQYLGKYEGKTINSLTGGSLVHPMVIVLPDDVNHTKKVICARSKQAAVDVVDYRAVGLDANIDETEWVIHSPNPGIFFARPIDGSSIVFRTSSDTSYFMGIENGSLRPLQPREVMGRRDYRADSRLHFHRIHYTPSGNAVRILKETSV